MGEAMARYAEGTSVSEERSRAELERTLKRFGADQFGFAWDQAGGQMIAFRMAGRSIRMDLPMPDPDDPTFTRTPTGQPRSTSAAQEAYAKEVRRRWRSLNLVVKAKLTAVADGISTLEREFLADMLTQDGRTVEQVMRPYLTAGGPLQLEAGQQPGIGR
jgi:hypothetical protein